MGKREIFRVYVVEALRELGGSASPLEVTKWVWQVHEDELRRAGDLFFTWQYDVRWAAQHLRDRGFLQTVDGNRRAPWALTDLGWSTDLEALS